MIAREYGYEILPGVAADTPGITDAARRGRRAGLVVGLPAVSVLGLVAAGLTAQGGMLTGLGLMCAAAALVTAGLVALWTRARNRELRILRTYPWQAWPCGSRSVRVVAASGERSGGRRWSSEGRVVLLQPDGQSHCSFPAPGRGVQESVWFAGDTRFGGVLAVPGGFPSRYVTRAKPGRRKGSHEEDALAARARLG
ncbi:hypothetical protein [Actinocorallia longicatena]|uniref:hypothetical protein n=1 Tax=Actinocorallia longicatena TaxID=111803 RepID=UPI0031E22581